MKKLLIIFWGLVFVVAKIGYTQEKDDLKNFRFGLKVQPSIAWYKLDDTKKFESDGSKIKFGYGLMTEFNLNKIVCFSTGIEINSTGGGIKYLDTAYYVPKSDTNKFYVKTRTFKSNYVDIPLTLKMKTPEIGTMTYFGQFGVNASIRWNAKTIDNGHFKNTTTFVDTDPLVATKEVGFFHLGLNVGAGFEMNLAGSTSFIVGVNYHNGFTNALKKASDILLDKTGNAVQQKVKAKSISLTIGILF